MVRRVFRRVEGWRGWRGVDFLTLTSTSVDVDEDEDENVETSSTISSAKPPLMLSMPPLVLSIMVLSIMVIVDTSNGCLDIVPLGCSRPESFHRSNRLAN